MAPQPSQEVVVITGGASGIGAACCHAFLARGASVMVLDRDPGAEAFARKIGAVAYAADVSDEQEVEACAGRIETEIGPVTALVNSAGIIQKQPLRPQHLPMTIWDDIVRVDQRGTWLTCRSFGSRMAARRAGSIINIASISGMRSTPFHAYSPAKAAVIEMTRCLAAEWGPAGVRVNCVSPGYTRTPALQAAIDRGERDEAALAALVALGRLADPSEIAAVVAFLASAAASAVTGINVPVDCGWLVALSWQTQGGLRGHE